MVGAVGVSASAPGVASGAGASGAGASGAAASGSGAVSAGAASGVSAGAASALVILLLTAEAWELGQRQALGTIALLAKMATTVDQLWLRFGPSLRVVCGRYGTSNLPDKHAELLAAFTNGNAQLAGEVMAGDVAQGMSQIRAALEGQPVPR